MEIIIGLIVLFVGFRILRAIFGGAKAVVKTAAITDGVDFKPYIGLEANAGAAEALNVHYQSISRGCYIITK